MKNLLCILTGSFLIFCSFSSSAQDQGSFLIKVTDFNGKPIQRAKAMVLGGTEHWASSGGLIVYVGEDDYKMKDGKYVKTSSMPLYLTVKAPYYKDHKIELSKYKLGSTILVKMERLDSDYKSLYVYVKNKDGKPLSGASVMVNPGKSTVTDANGYVEAQHVHVIDEWVIVEVYKEGFKKQRQQIKSGDATRIVKGQVIPASTLYFTLEKGENETTIFHINVEVLDGGTDEAVPGALVWLEISDGTAQTGTTNASGEVRFSDMEYSFQGTTSKVMVKKTGYEEKWSDITADLMTGKDNPERQFVVYIKKKSPDCNSSYPNSEARLNPQTNVYECYCKTGYEWNSTRTACVPAKPDCNSYYANSEAKLNAQKNVYECYCKTGYEWNATRTACVPAKSDCNSYYANSEARLNPQTNVYECYCKTGYEWNATRTACVPAKSDCNSYYANSEARLNPQTNVYECYCKTGYEWNSSRTACVPEGKIKDPITIKECTEADKAAFAKITGSWKAYRMHVTIGGSCDNVTGTWKVTEWCEGVDETYNASVARVNGTLKGKMQNGYLQLDIQAPPSPNNSKGTKVSGSCSIKADGMLSCSFGCPGDLKKQ